MSFQLVVNRKQRKGKEQGWPKETRGTEPEREPRRLKRKMPGEHQRLYKESSEEGDARINWPRSQDARLKRKSDPQHQRLAKRSSGERHQAKMQG